MRQKLVIWGSGGHALVVADIIRLQGEYEVIGFIDNIYPERRNTILCGVPILGGLEQLEILPQLGADFVIVGFGNCNERLKLSEMLSIKGFQLATAIHPRSIIAEDVQLGAGSVIAAGSVINPGAIIGDSVIINTCASVDHECIIENGAHICPGVRLAGKVHVGRAAWVGIGSTIIDKIRIGNNTFIGAGAVVVSDIPNNVIAYGVPAKVIREIQYEY